MLLDEMADKFPGLTRGLCSRPHAERARQAVPHCELDRGTRVMIFPRTPVLGEALREWGDQKTIVNLMARFSNHDVRTAAHHAARRATQAMAALPPAPAPARFPDPPQRPAPRRRPAPLRRPAPVSRTAPQPVAPPLPATWDTVPVFIPHGQEDPDKSFWGEETPEPRRWLRRRSRAAS